MISPDTMVMLKKIKFIFVFITCYFLSISANGFAEEQHLIDGFSINPKFGWYFDSEHNDGLISGVDFNVLKKNVLFSAGFYHGAEFHVLGPNPEENNTQINLMVGKSSGNRYFKLQYQVGISSIWGVKRGALIEEDTTGLFISSRYEKSDFFTIGFPIKLGFKFVPSRFFSIGIDLQANLNSERSILMCPMLNVEIGKLRNE